MTPVEFALSSGTEHLSSRAGLDLIGRLPARTRLADCCNAIADPDRLHSHHSHANCLGAFLGVCEAAKPDVDTADGVRKAPFFTQAPGLHALPYAPTVRQQFEGIAANPETLRRVTAVLFAEETGFI